MQLGVGSWSISVRVAGSKLAERLFAPLRHVQSDWDAQKPDIEILAWSVEETGVPSPAGFPFEWNEAGESVIVASFPSADQLTRLSLARPFQRALVALLSERGLHAVHGALLAPPQSTTGLLLIGPNGSGKSTTCLSAILAGFQLVGEDCLAIERSAECFVGRSIYCSCNLTHSSRSMFAALPWSQLLPHGAAADAKSVMLLPPSGPGSPMVRQLDVAAVVFPEIKRAGDESAFVPISRADAYRRLMPGLRLMRHFDPEARQRHHDAVAALVAELPCYRLDLGTDVTQVPARLTELAAGLR
jgi:hypothetical protein